MVVVCCPKFLKLAFKLPVVDTVSVHSFLFKVRKTLFYKVKVFKSGGNQQAAEEDSSHRDMLQ